MIFFRDYILKEIVNLSSTAFLKTHQLSQQGLKYEKQTSSRYCKENDIESGAPNEHKIYFVGKQCPSRRSTSKGGRGLPPPTN